MQALPIDPLLPELCRELAESRALVLEAPPGAGKTTRVPRALLESEIAKGGEVLVTEPRRLAARMAARRVADELGEPVGQRVGYRVRFEEVRGPKTRLFYVTEGVLVRRLLDDPELRGVAAVVLDEFHERHLDTDLLLALLARLRATTRPDLAVVVMSATLDAEPVAAFLGDCPRLRSEGRVYPLSIEHLAAPDERPLEKQVVSAARSAIDGDESGDVLVFLPGASEIRRTQQALEVLARERDLRVVPLHGDLPLADQVRAIEAGPRRKVVLSTNVAESSVTIEGITAVIDSGLARVASHSPWSGLPTLRTVKVSRASAVQRAGRAGRTRPGRVLRLYTQGDFSSRPAHDLPEVMRADLAESTLVLAGLGASMQAELRWLSSPPDAHREAALELLRLLGALDVNASITALGRRMLDLPLHPRLGRIVLEGERRGVPEDAALVAALLGERDIRSASRTDFSKRGGVMDSATGPSDLLELADQFEIARSLGFQADRLRAHGLDPRSVSAVAQAERKLSQRLDTRRVRDVADREQALLIAILTGFPDRAAKRRHPGGAELVLTNGSTARLSPASVVRNDELMVAIDVEEQSGRSLGLDASVRLASAIRADWLLDLYSERVRIEETLVFNPNAERVEALSRMTFGALVLDESRSAAPPSAEATRVLAEAVRDQGALEFLKSDALSEFRERLSLVAKHYGDAGSAEPVQAGDLELLALCEGITSFEELRARGTLTMLKQNLTPKLQHLLERAAPETFRLGSGRVAKIHYEAGKPPWLESRLQDFFGCADGPRVCDGRVPVTLHLLAPNGRAVQVTSDLAGFWERHYPAIRRELMRRYPRHSWPEDGRHAEPPPPRQRR
jgi:ATP-dependent helicase HrpB